MTYCLTDADRQRAIDFLADSGWGSQAFADLRDLPQDAIDQVAWALRNGEEDAAIDHLEEWLDWHSPAGRLREAREIFESGHPLGGDR